MIRRIITIVEAFIIDKNEIKFIQQQITSYNKLHFNSNTYYSKDIY